MTEVQIKQENKTYLQSPKIQIQVKLAPIHEQITLEVNAMQTIHDVKAKIQQEESIPVEEIDLIYCGEQLDNSRTLSSFGLGNGATLYAIVPAKHVMRLSIYLGKDERTVKLRVKGWYTVEDVKNMIESMIGVPVERQRLYLDEKQLSNDSILEDLCVPKGKSISMFSGLLLCLASEVARILEHQLTPNLEVSETDTIENVRKQANLSDREILTYKGRKLENWHTLAYYHVKNGDVIYYATGRTIMKGRK